VDPALSDHPEILVPSHPAVTPEPAHSEVDHLDHSVVTPDHLDHSVVTPDHPVSHLDHPVVVPAHSDQVTLEHL